MMEGSSHRRILCCDTKEWGYVIGGLNFVGAILMLVIATAALAGSPLANVLFLSILKLDPVEPDLKPSDVFFVLRGATMVYSCFCMVLSSVLLEGIQKGNAKMLKIWLYVEAILLIVGTMYSFGSLIAVSDDGVRMYTVLTTLMALLIGGFFWWVINVHLTELQNKSISSNANHSTITANYCVKQSQVTVTEQV